jgi:bifunctional DNA-binding transcriptional regulator/antitoxin component of YhaV-PrlF toxin-antitoxin module
LGVVVKVTRRDQTAVPVEQRTRLGIKEGNYLLIEETVQGLLIRGAPDLIDLAGVDARHGTIEQAEKMVERMREEYGSVNLLAHRRREKY